MKRRHNSSLILKYITLTKNLFFFFFFFNDTATTEIYTLSLHDALPIFAWPHTCISLRTSSITDSVPATAPAITSVCPRSEEHTSELQSQSNLVCRLLLEKKKESRLYLRLNLY